MENGGLYVSYDVYLNSMWCWRCLNNLETEFKVDILHDEKNTLWQILY